jgi:broad specificity phosphatase PhoE
VDLAADSGMMAFSSKVLYVARMKFLFARHAESEANVFRVISNRGLVHPLTVRGREQARDLGENLRWAGVTEVLSSPLLRATETAAIVSHELGLERQIADALREYDCGDIEGKADDASWEVHAAALRAWLQESRMEVRTAGGESYEEIRDRFVPFIEGLKHNDGVTLLIGHGGVFRLLLPEVLKNVDRAMVSARDIPHCGVITAETLGEDLMCTNWCGDTIAAPG